MTCCVKFLKWSTLGKPVLGFDANECKRDTVKVILWNAKYLTQQGSSDKRDNKRVVMLV